MDVSTYADSGTKAETIQKQRNRNVCRGKGMKTRASALCRTWTLQRLQKKASQAGSTHSGAAEERTLPYLRDAVLVSYAQSDTALNGCLVTVYYIYTYVSVQLSRSVVSDSLRPHEPQHARPPCPSPTPGVYPNPCPLSRWCHPTISSSVVPFSSCPQPFPASGSFPMSQLFASGGQSIGTLYLYIYIWWSLYYIYISLYRQIYIYTHIYIFTCVYVWWSCHQNTWWCLTEQKWLLLHHWIYIAQSHVHNSSQCFLNLENCWDKTFICHQHVGASARLWEYTR